MPKYNNLRKTWFYSNEFKIKAVKLSYQPDIQSKQVADGQKRIGVSNKRKSLPKKQLTENAKLEKEVERLNKENDFLKKWQQFLAESHLNQLNQMKFY